MLGINPRNTSMKTFVDPEKDCHSLNGDRGHVLIHFNPFTIMFYHGTSSQEFAVQVGHNTLELGLTSFTRVSFLEWGASGNKLPTEKNHNANIFKPKSILRRYTSFPL